MSVQKSTDNAILEAVAELGTGPLKESSLVRSIHPLFSRVLQRKEIYLANHSLGRPLDQMAIDVQQALDLWYQDMDGAWDGWLAEIQAFRGRIAQLIHAPREDCIIPKTSAGQGLRAILNCFDKKIRVVTTTAEFGSVDHILKVYAQRDRIDLIQVGPDDQGVYHEEDILDAIGKGADLIVVSMVLFITGQYLTGLRKLISEAQTRGVRVLVDLYHAVGVLPANMEDLGADFAIGGCYKYLRGGPGACWLYVHPCHLNGSLNTLDTGWFAQPKPFAFQRPDTPYLSEGGNAFLESTPPILPYYQAKAGLMFTLSMGVDRLRAYSLKLQARLSKLLAQHDLQPIGHPDRRGAFLAIAVNSADAIASQLRAQKIIVDARNGLLRICPDILTTEEELGEAVGKLAAYGRRDN
ncbi:aminotransferase class V-fold PLP-dependent enzyme [Candidatus Nitronereus thalassa]|uniref:Aminotransferase class V-fold PLP-dependent enzyme n=1 Tax=Candidatus Nitronereus thalassa TaxID=3020898 RepID=A0ABU3K4J2_9BACT|nr:aminotransferase class V-fold PLP-dependent enzyme [Candidatus Nitronereus thalassa]MDT7041322.1 aminotransferase class V-fold PLP-dependent enzyme [Candidatus Nitronereus thalassa]